MCAGGNGYPKAHRLRQRDDYIRINRMGRKIHTPHFIVLIMNDPSFPTRLGVTVSRKVGNAVIRNRVKRLLREYFRQHYSGFIGNISILIIAKRGAGQLDQAMVNAELATLLQHRDQP